MEEAFKEFDQEITLNGKPLTVKVQVFVEEDPTDPADTFGFGDQNEDAEHLARFTKGELFLGFIVVKVSALGITGQDSLGACELVPNNMFDQNPFADDVNTIVQENDMILNAINDFKNEINLIIEKLKPYMGRK